MLVKKIGGFIEMTKFDKEYLELAKRILTEGVEVENRTGINTIKVPSHFFEFDLSREFPILQSKQVFIRQAVTEMLWIWQMQSNDVKELNKRNIHIWDQWKVDKDGIYRIYEPNVPGVEYKYEPNKEVVVLDPLSVPIYDPLGHRNPFKPKYDEFGKVMTAKSEIPGLTIKTAKYYGKEYADTIGTGYGFLTNLFQMTQDMQDVARNHRTERKTVCSLWQNPYLRTAVLPSCVWSVEFDVTDDKLNFMVHQRSCDLPLGLPFNITQYATFLKMMAQTTGLEPGKLSYSIKDAHIYIDQIDKIKEQIMRWDRYEKMQNWSEIDLIQRQLYLNDLIETKKDFFNDDELRDIDSELRTIDIILNPTTPELWLNPEIKDFFEFDNSVKLKDCKIKNYKHMGKLPFPLTQ